MGRGVLDAALHGADRSLRLPSAGIALPVAGVDLYRVAGCTLPLQYCSDRRIAAPDSMGAASHVSRETWRPSHGRVVVPVAHVRSIPRSVSRSSSGRSSPGRSSPGPAPVPGFSPACSASLTPPSPLFLCPSPSLPSVTAHPETFNAYPIAQEKHPVALNKHVRILQHVLHANRPDVGPARPEHDGCDVSCEPSHPGLLRAAGRHRRRCRARHRPCGYPQTSAS